MATRNQEANQTCQLLKHLHLLGPDLVYQPGLGPHRGHGVSGLLGRGWAVGGAGLELVTTAVDQSAADHLQPKVAGETQKLESFCGG